MTERLTDQQLRDLKRWRIEKGCECRNKDDLVHCFHCITGTLTPEMNDERIDEILDQAQKDIDRFGWHVLYIQGDKDNISFGYSIGLWEKFKHPEIIILQLNFETTITSINNVCRLVEMGKKFGDGDGSRNVLRTPVRFVEVSKKYYNKYFKMWFNRYEHFGFDAVQMLWTDTKGKFPDDPNYEKKFISQLMLNK